jgi:hypothetical protein
MTAIIPATGLHGDPTLTCHYCGSTEVMPADLAAQDRFLRLRLMQVRRSREALEAPLRSFEMVRQSWALGLVFFVLMGGWQMWQAFCAVEKAPIQTTLFAVLGASCVVGVIFGYVGMSRAFRVLVRPLLQARAPEGRGLSARCRTCGGDLPDVRTAQIQCGYCGAHNFVDAALAHDIDNQLARERAAFQRRAQGEHPSDGSAYRQPAKSFYRWTVAGAVATFGVGMAIVLFVLR